MTDGPSRGRPAIDSERWRRLAARWRRPAAWVVFALAVIATIASVLTIWAKRQALDTDAWTRTSTELLESAEVREAVSTYLVDELFDGIDVAAQLSGVLPDRLDPISGPAAAALRELAIDQAQSLLASGPVQDLWAQANRRAHEALLALLDDESVGPVSLVDGAVVLDLRPLVSRLRDRLGLGGELAGDVGLVTLLEADEVTQAQRAVNALRRLTILLFLVALALYAAAIWLAAGARRTMLAACGAALLGVGFVLLVVRRVAGEGLVEALVEAPSSRPAATVAWLVSTSMLRDIAIALAAYGAVALAGAWLSGGSRPARAVRKRLAPALLGYPVAVFAAVALVFLLVLVWSPLETDRRLYGTLLLAVLIMAGVELLRRQTRREAEEAERRHGYGR